MVLNMFCLLGEENNRHGWNLSTSTDEKFSFLNDHFPASNGGSSVTQHPLVSVLLPTQQQCTTAAVREIHPSPTPSQRRRALRRYQRWADRRTRSVSDQPQPHGTATETVVCQQASDPKVHEKASCDSNSEGQETVMTVVLPMETTERQQEDMTSLPLPDFPYHVKSGTEASVTSWISM